MYKTKMINLLFTGYIDFDLLEEMPINTKIYGGKVKIIIKEKLYVFEIPDTIRIKNGAPVTIRMESGRLRLFCKLEYIVKDDRKKSF
jgi:hypothetical protein